jgi:hypothetical protein
VVGVLTHQNLIPADAEIERLFMLHKAFGAVASSSAKALNTRAGEAG